MPGANWTGGGRTTAKIQSKARVTRAHFGKQRLIQRNIGHHEPSAQLIAISLAHATAKPVSSSTVGSSISPGPVDASRVIKMADDTPIHHGSSHKRKLDLFQALDEGNPAAFEIKRKRLLAAPNLAGLPVVETRGSSNDYASRSPASLPTLGSPDVASIPDEVDQSSHALHCSSPLPPTPKVIFEAPFSPQHSYSQEIFASGDVIDCKASSSATYNPEFLINGPRHHFSPPPTPHSALHFVASDVAQFSSTYSPLMVESPCSAANSAINHFEGRPETLAPPTHDDPYISGDLRVAWKAFVDDVHIYPSSLPSPSPYEELEWLTSIPENAGADFRLQTAAQFPVLDAGDTDAMTIQGSLDSRIITCPRTPLALSNPVNNLHLQQTGASDFDYSALHLYPLNDTAGKKNECNRDVCAVSIDDRGVLHLSGPSGGLEVTHKYEQNGILANDDALVSSPDSFRTPSPCLVPRDQGVSEQGIHFRATAHIPWSPERMTGLECNFRVLGRENRYSERSVSNARQSSEEADAQPNLTSWESPVLNNIDLTKHCAQRDASPHREIAVRDNEDKPPSTNHSTDTVPVECPSTNAPTQVGDDIPPLRTISCLHSADCCPLIGATASDSINNGESGSMSSVPEGGSGKESGAYSVCDGAVSLGIGQILGPDLFGSDQNEHDEDS